jgi:hypothetical protein
MKGIKGIRLRIQCVANPNHAKIIPFADMLKDAPTEVFFADPLRQRNLKLYLAQKIGQALCGYIHIYKPGARSPIGKCALCGGALDFTIEELGEGKNAEISGVVAGTVADHRSR